MMPAANTSSHSAISVPPQSLNDSLPDASLMRAVAAERGDHSHVGRLFVGPMPIKVAAPLATEKDNSGKTKHWWLSLRDHKPASQESQDDTGNDDHDDVPERHAFRYFLHVGGREEEWEAHETLRRRTKREMLRQWKQSGWHHVSHPRNKSGRQAKKWVGQTFQIGKDFLGVPMHTTQDAASLDPSSLTSPTSQDATSSPEVTPHKAVSAHETARERRSESISGESSGRLSSSSSPNRRDSRLTNGSGVALLSEGESSRRPQTARLPRLLSVPSMSSKFKIEGLAQEQLSDISAGNTPTPQRSALRRLQTDNVKGKSVQFSSVEHQAPPVSPSEVLARRSSNNPDTSDGAAAAQSQTHGNQRENAEYGDVFLSDTMLVRRSHTRSGNTGSYFDAEKAMKLRDLCNYDWKEYLLVWRKDKLELYENYSIPGKEMILGHKHLAFVIPLQKPDTKLSLYSFTDLTFCLTCTSLNMPQYKSRTTTSLSIRIPFHRNSGTDIFVFKGKTRSRSIDWMWNIWRWLGNDITGSLDVYCPATENRVRLHVPEFDEHGGEGYKVFTRDHVVELCRAALMHLPSWNYLVEGPLSRGARLELCWRRETMLDWVRWERDADGSARHWEVLYGLCLGKPQQITHLEARIAEHRPTSLFLPDGTHLQEPPGVEGYLYRIKPRSQSRAQVYVSTHSGCLFLINSGRAQPPRPPIPVEDGAVQDEDVSAPFQETEVQRGTMQILEADIFIDFRSIASVRQAFQIYAPPQNSNGPQNGQPQPQERVEEQVDTTRGDDDDEGGDEALSRHHDKPKLKMKRSFELLMDTGSVVRFEAYSCAVAREWITHLTLLVEYWKHRHRVDAQEEMELIHSVTGNSQTLLAHPDKESYPERPPDCDESCEYLPSFWNWCVLDGCSSVVKNGRLYLRRGFRGQYRLMQLVLVQGHLIQFHLIYGTAHHLRSKTTSLLDAYVCSGHFAIQALPVEEFLTDSEPLPRRFQDGLENDDPESDKILVIWYRSYAAGKAKPRRGMDKNSSSDTVTPPLNPRRKILVLKARSRIERNSWCWALNAVIESMSRGSGGGMRDQSIGMQT